MVSGVPATKFPETWTPLNSSKESLTRTRRRFLHLFYKSLRAQRVSILGNFCNSQFNPFIFFDFFAQIGLKVSGCKEDYFFYKAKHDHCELKFFFLVCFVRRIWIKWKMIFKERIFVRRSLVGPLKRQRLLSRVWCLHCFPSMLI